MPSEPSRSWSSTLSRWRSRPGCSAEHGERFRPIAAGPCGSRFSRYSRSADCRAMRLGSCRLDRAVWACGRGHDGRAGGHGLSSWRRGADPVPVPAALVVAIVIAALVEELVMRGADTRARRRAAPPPLGYGGVDRHRASS